MEYYINLNNKYKGGNNTDYRKEIEVVTSTFPGGEEHIRIEEDFDYPFNKQIDTVVIFCLIDNSKEVMKLLMVTDALRNQGVKNIEVVIPYLPYARQDNIFNKGEALSVRVFAQLLNTQNYNKVTILDPHSNVGPSHINNVEIIDNHNFVKESLTQYGDDYTLVAPDAGALKKIFKLAQELEVENVVTAEKLRNTKTGEIIRTVVHGDESDIKDKHMVIVDDICDGGRTFIEIGKVLKEKGAKTVTLIVSHGIFSKGFEVFDGLIDYIFTTTSFGTERDVPQNVYIKPFE
jgi:ribose-phosphate pyrophosphokinase